MRWAAGLRSLAKALKRRQRRILVAILLAGVVAILLAMVYSQFRQSVYVHRAFIPALVVFSGPEGQPLYDYYTAREGATTMEATGAPGGFYDVDPPRAMRRVLTVQDLKPLHARIEAGGYRRVYLVQAYTQWADPSDLVMVYLNGQFHEAGGIQDRAVRVRAFARTRSR